MGLEKVQEVKWRRPRVPSAKGIPVDEYHRFLIIVIIIVSYCCCYCYLQLYRIWLRAYGTLQNLEKLYKA